MNTNFSKESEIKINKMVDKIVSKAGLTSKGNMTYKELFQAHIERVQSDIQNIVNEHLKKLSLKPGNIDFAEEIKTYLKDGLQELIKEGYSEEEALNITLDKFDDGEINEIFKESLENMGAIKLNKEEVIEWQDNASESLGLFYGSFVILGASVGGLIGYFQTWIC